MKARPIIIVIVTLLIGFAIGMLVSAQLRFHRLKPVRMFFSEQRFREGYYNIIQPDDKQRETIDNLLMKYGKVNISFQNEFRKKLDSLMKEFWREIEPVLTKEQMERIRESEQRRSQMYRQDWRMQRDSNGFRDRSHRIPPPHGRGGPGPGRPFHERN